MHSAAAAGTGQGHETELKGSSHFGVWGVVLAWGRGLPDD